MTAEAKRQKVVNKYKTILGRNNYSQAKRSYCYKKYSNGKYYSDCSSSVALTYKECGLPFKDKSGNSNPNTVGMYQSPDLVDVPVKIVNGIIQNPEILRQGDMLLFAGKDNSRRHVDCVGHVEMVANITASKITLYGHGSGTPRETEMNAYCRSRYNSKVSTVIGHRGLLKVRRFILDGDSAKTDPITGTKIVVNDGRSVHVRSGPSSDYKYLCVALANTEFAYLHTEGWYPIKLDKIVAWVSDKYAELNRLRCEVVITGGTVNLRSGPGTKFTAIKTAKKGTTFKYADPNGWWTIEYGGFACWITSRYTTKTV